MSPQRRRRSHELHPELTPRLVDRPLRRRVAQLTNRIVLGAVARWFVALLDEVATRAVRFGAARNIHRVEVQGQSSHM